MKAPNTKSQDFEFQWQGTLSDYVTAVAWSPQGNILAASSAAGEVVLWDSGELSTLQEPNDKSVDCLAFSKDGQFLASGGQDGKVKIYRISTNEAIITLENAPAWVDKLAWNPTRNELAFSLGRYVQVWDVEANEIVVTLNFESSSVLGIDWRCDGKYLAICGNQGIKIWKTQDWDDDPYIVDIPAASLVMAWSPDGKFIASGNIDRTITVVDSQLLLSGEPPEPWIMRGFPGKIRQLTWSDVKNNQGAPLLACSSVEGIAVWEKLADENLGWDARILTNHSDVIQAIAFQPKSLLLASAAEDGWLCLWQKAKRVSQIIQGAPNGFSCLAWQPQGNHIAAGGVDGELIIWSHVKRGQGFGKR
jgi:WD40 repeat protein